MRAEAKKKYLPSLDTQDEEPSDFLPLMAGPEIDRIAPGVVLVPKHHVVVHRPEVRLLAGHGEDEVALVGGDESVKLGGPLVNRGRQLFGRSIVPVHPFAEQMVVMVQFPTVAVQ